MKYYPLAKNALWKSERFRLEPLPDAEVGVMAKVLSYFPYQWRLACAEDAS
ncbi:MAG: hypothetical protein IT210_21780 [Armatimonadetes bacterium]|nr:hypothetical protein [Armatimonadota bacterium]